LADSSAGSRGVLWGGAALTLALAALAQVILRSHRKISQALRSSVDANRRLASSQAALRLAGTVMNASPLGIFVTDAQRQVVSVNPAFTRITGLHPGEVIGKQPEWFLQTQQAVDLPSMWNDVEQQGNWAGELDCRRKDGSVYPQRLAMTRVTGENGQTENCVGLFQDITEQRKAEANIRRLAHHDYLTGLPNRALLVERATQELLAASRYGHKPVILFIDLDRFKPINDAHGHETGDEVLVEVARRLGSLLRETDLVCRQGGDEFVVLLPDHHTEEGLISLAQKLLDAIETPYTVKGRSLELSASIGIAIFPEHGDTVDKLIQNADAAMYQAKAQPGQKIWLAGATPETENLAA
jgi:diguanylate cyclase (GGDEF)-like protein/PAS domain S-box-containing protein